MMTITTQESADSKVVKVSPTDLDGYHATGNLHEENYTGPYEAMLAMLTSVTGSKRERVTASLSRLPGNVGSLNIRREEYEADDEDDNGQNENPGDSRDSPSWQVQITTSDESLLTHPRYYEKFSKPVVRALSLLIAEEDEGDKMVVDGVEREIGDVVEEGGELALEAQKKIKDGQKAFRMASCTLTCRYRIKKGEVAELRDPCTIQQPPGFYPTPKGRNWLFLGSSVEHDGKEIWVSEVYQLSGPKGWDSDLYGGKGGK